MRRAIAIAALILLGAVGGPAAAAADLRAAALAALAESLGQPGPTPSGQLLARIARAADLDTAQVGAGLRALLDTLDAGRRAGSATWQALTALGDNDVDPARVDRLLRAAIDRGRKACAGGADDDLDGIVAAAAAQAGIAPDRARQILGLAVAAGRSARSDAPVRLPDRVGVLVTGASTYRVGAGRFPGLLVTADDPSSLARCRDLHVAVARALVDVLPQVGGVRWAIGAPHPGLAPDCVLRFEITDFYSTFLRRGTSGIGPVVTVATHVALEGARDGARLYSEDLTLTYDFRRERDDLVRTQRRLDGVAAKAAAELRASVARYLAGRRPD